MPQPLSRFDPKLGFVIGAGNAPHDPRMAASVLAVINLWSQIEYNYAAILSRIARADATTVQAVFQSMVSGEARQAALFAAAKEKRTPEEASLIMAVVDSTKASRKARNAFAHHIWGSLNTRPDCVVLMHPKALAKNSAQWAEWSLRHPEGVTFPLPDGTPMPEFPPALDRSEIMVWRQPDFDTEVQSAVVAHDRIVQLLFSLDHPVADHRRQALLADPQIERRYNLRLAENTE